MLEFREDHALNLANAALRVTLSTGFDPQKPRVNALKDKLKETDWESLRDETLLMVLNAIPRLEFCENRKFDEFLIQTKRKKAEEILRPDHFTPENAMAYLDSLKMRFQKGLYYKIHHGKYYIWSGNIDNGVGEGEVSLSINKGHSISDFLNDVHDVYKILYGRPLISAQIFEYFEGTIYESNEVDQQKISLNLFSEGSNHLSHYEFAEKGMGNDVPLAQLVCGLAAFIFINQLSPEDLKTQNGSIIKTRGGSYMIWFSEDDGIDLQQIDAPGLSKDDPSFKSTSIFSASCQREYPVSHK